MDWLLTNLGPIWAALGHREKTKQSYLRALLINPDLPEAHNNMGVLLYADGDFDGARYHFEKAVSLESDDVRFHNLGLSLRKLDNTSAALEAFNNALRINPFNYKALNEIGLIEMNKGNLQSARGIFLKGLRVNPADENLKYNFDLVNRQIGQ